MTVEALNLPESITIRFKAATTTTCESRDEVREALAKACEGFPVTVLDGFKGVAPYPQRREPETRNHPKYKRVGYNRTRTREPLITDEVLAKVGGVEAMAGYLGLHINSVKLWGAYVPQRHELLTRELLRNWKKITTTKAILAEGGTFVRAAVVTNSSTEELLSTFTRFNIPTKA